MPASRALPVPFELALAGLLAGLGGCGTGTTPDHAAAMAGAAPSAGAGTPSAGGTGLTTGIGGSAALAGAGGRSAGFGGGSGASGGGRSGAGGVGGIAAGGTAGGAGAAGGGSGSDGAAAGRGTGGVAGEMGGSGAGLGGVGNAGAGGMAGAAAGAPSVGTPKNPVLSGLNADPQIASFAGRFFIYPTSDGFADWRSTSFHAFSSSDLVSWHDEGIILDLGPDVSWADERAWAPGIAYKAGTYYFYFSASQQIGVATSSSPLGPFKDALGHPLVTTGQYGGQSIDPFVFSDDDGRSYLYFGSTSAGGHVVELGDDMISFKGTPQVIAISGFQEGSLAFKRNGTYYFMYSEGDTRSADYDVAYGTGASPFGPFTKAKVNPILKRNDSLGILGTGHNSVLALPNGDYYIAYHRFAIPDGDGTHREVCLDKLEFNADGTIVPVVPTR